VTGALSRNRFPFDWCWYEPQLVEISIVFGTFMLFLFLYTLAARFLPLIPVWEVEEGQHSHTWRRVGKAILPAVSDLESLD
jgi:molybdopterin-containing oxidoreductase family membrane subunit